MKAAIPGSARLDFDARMDTRQVTSDIPWRIDSFGENMEETVYIYRYMIYIYINTYLYMYGSIWHRQVWYWSQYAWWRIPYEVICMDLLLDAIRLHGRRTSQIRIFVSNLSDLHINTSDILWIWWYSSDVTQTYPPGNDHVSHLWKRKIIPATLPGDMLVPWRVSFP